MHYALRTAYSAINQHLSRVTLRITFLGVCTRHALLAGLSLFLAGRVVGTAVAIGALIVFAPRRLWMGLLLAAITLIGLMGLASAGVLPSAISERLADAGTLLDIRDVRGMPINDANYALIERQAHWQAALNMLTDRPWTGVGFSNYQPLYEQYAR
jgi:O-antigen ligase